MLLPGKGASLGRGGVGGTLAQQNKVGGVPDHGVLPEKGWATQKWGGVLIDVLAPSLPAPLLLLTIVP